MKHTITYSFLFLLSFLIDLKSQDYIRIDSIISVYPKSFSKPDILAKKICLDFPNPKDKARAIYTWIAKNVKYDVDTYFSKVQSDTYEYENKEDKIYKELQRQDKVAKRTLKRRLAVCYGYSVLFKKLCDLCSIQCEIITGGAKTKESQIGKTFSLGAHAWNAVKIDEKWELIDVTWGAGYVDDKRKTFISRYTDSYCFTVPEKFFLNHFPRDTSWILTNKTKAEFINLPLYYTDYITSDLNILCPNDGELNIKELDSIYFKLSGFSQVHYLSYTFSNSKLSHNIDPKLINVVNYEFKIINNLTKNGYLTLYLDSKAIVSYKINTINTHANTVYNP
jgi:Transglutaminase-like superfamily